jgi:Cu/Zn superoxide dismutase
MRRTVLIFAALTLGLALVGAGCGSEEDDGGTEAQVGGEILMVELEEQNGSGESGTAELRGEDGQTIVEISLDGAPAAAQPAHIHKGTCENLDPTPAYPLEDVADGRSTSTEAVTLEELRNGEYAINVHKSNEEPQTYVACGNLGSGTGGGSMGDGEGY